MLTNLTDLQLSSIDLFSFDGGNGTASDASIASRSYCASGSCKAYPGDARYPSEIIWDVFGLLVGRHALIKTVPIAAPCYTNWGVEDAERCSFVRNNWANDSYMHSDDPTSVMWPLYEGLTCMPTDTPSANCTLGGFPSYAVAVTNVAQIQLAVNFARNANLRLVVKNTGHDFNGKSAGAGALSIWTHKLKQVKFYPTLTQDKYTGMAFKIGTGIQAYELYAAADANNVTVVGGEGRSVGVMGGYILGGGHSPLSSLYGTASDQVLSMEVVLPNGQFVTASNSSNPDLFWALRGGGGSTFGVITSVTVKARPRINVSVATFSISTGASVTADLFWQGMSVYFKYLPVFSDAGTYSYFNIFNLGSDSYSFGMAPFFAPTLSEAQLKALLAPFLAEIDALGIPVIGLTYYAYDNYYDAWWTHFPLETIGSTNIKTASRLFPRANFEPATGNATLLNQTVAAIRSTAEQGATVLAFNIAANPSSGYPDSAVNPAWRKTVLHAIQAIAWDEGASDEVVAAACLKLTNEWMGEWRATCPEAGAYMSEADILEPNFQQSFYGTSNYNRLYALKQKLDPWGLFYAPTGVGSEDWYITGQIDGLPTQNGRLCHV